VGHAVVERDVFIEAMSRAVTGVTVVTTDGPAGRAGMTVSAMSSVSADPPTLLVCVNAASRTGTAIERNGVFCVNVLDSSQAAVADRFAGRDAKTTDRFAVGDWRRGVSGAPGLYGAVVRFDCAVHLAAAIATHTVYFGHVIDAAFENCVPLLYWQRQYGLPLPSTARASCADAKGRQR
jgi:flavin reductase